MNIVVLVKMVPDTESRLEIVDGKLKESGFKYMVNPYDEFGLTKALQIKESNAGSTVTVMHVGLSNNDPIIRKSLAIGADDAVRINTTANDPIQVANEIAHYIKENPFDLIITGKESIDYNGAVVPHALGELLKIPSVSPCTGLEINEGEALITGVVDGGKEELSAKLPLIVGSQKGLVEESELRIPNMRGIMQARSKPLNVVEAKKSDATQKIINYDKPPQKAACKLIDANNVEELVSLLQNEAKVI